MYIIYNILLKFIVLNGFCLRWSCPHLEPVDFPPVFASASLLHAIKALKSFSLSHMNSRLNSSSTGQ